MGDKKNIRRICEAAGEAFWAKVAELVPAAKTGDLAPDADIPFRRACLAVVSAWLEENLPGAEVTAARCDLIVEMRPPKKGERGWMVEALTAEDALAEVLKESEEFGWVADKDHAPGFDDHGMHAVTISFRPEIRALTQDELMKVQGFTDAPLGAITAGTIVKAAYPAGWSELVDALPEYKGWTARYDYPGYINWSHPDRPMFVCATPDFHQPGSIAVDVQDNYGRVFHQAGDVQDLLWPVGANRTAATYMGVIGPILDKVFVMPYHEEATEKPVVPEGGRDDGNDIYQEVLAAMQNAEEMGGPTGQKYIDLMTRIANEAMQRCRNYRMTLLQKEGA